MLRDGRMPSKSWKPYCGLIDDPPYRRFDELRRELREERERESTLWSSWTSLTRVSFNEELLHELHGVRSLFQRNRNGSIPSSLTGYQQRTQSLAESRKSKGADVLE